MSSSGMSSSRRARRGGLPTAALAIGGVAAAVAFALMVFGPVEDPPSETASPAAGTSLAPASLDTIADAVETMQFAEKAAPEGFLWLVLSHILTPPKEPAPAAKGALPTWRDRRWGLVFTGKNAPPRDSLKKVLDESELDEFRRLPGQVAAAAWRGEVDRNWLGTPTPSDLARYEDAADLIERGGRRRAEKLMSAAAKEGDANALYLVALANIDNPVSARITINVVKPMRQAAELGHADAAVRLGHYARFGHVVERDAQAARRWYETALARGSARAATALGDLLLAGDGVKRDPEAALVHYEDAAELGDAAAATKIGVMHLDGTAGYPDYLSAEPWFEQAAKAGDRQAQWYLAGVYARDDGGGVVDHHAFLEWAKKAATQGQADALLALGLYHQTGMDGRQPADTARAITLIRAAALRSHAEGLFSYAELHDLGIGTEPDPVKALMFYRLALRNGHASAQASAEALLPDLTCAQYAAATNAYKAFYMVTRITRELNTGPPKQRHGDPPLALGALATCVVPTAPRQAEIEELQVPAWFEF